jgi:DNA-binding CsgD family transcriptional regulator
MQDIPSFLTTAEWRATTETLGLSGREREIVGSMIEGKSEAEIASHLGISPHTVHTHLERLHRKLKVTSRPHLIGRVLEAFASVARRTSQRVD